MSLGNVGLGSLGGPSKRTRQIMREKATKAPMAHFLASIDIIQSTIEVGKELV